MRVRSHAHASTHAWNIGDEHKKACLVWLRKRQDVRQITHLKQQRLSFTFCKTQRSYKKIMSIHLLFHWFSGENCIIRSRGQRCSYKKMFLKFAKFTGEYKCQSLFFNKFAGTATSLLIVLTWKLLNIVCRNLMKFFKVLPKENLKSAYKRQGLQQKQQS